MLPQYNKLGEGPEALKWQKSQMASEKELKETKTNKQKKTMFKILTAVMFVCICFWKNIP